MKTQIRGTTMQILDVELSQGEAIFSETGSMAWMSPNIEMDSNLEGGVGGALGRMFTGESLFMTNYTCSEGTGSISFCMESPGKIVPITLAEGESIICQKDAFLVGQRTVTLKTEFKKKLGAGLFGGEGFFLQRITGPGTVWLELPGEITEYTLAEGQALKVDPGYLAAFEPSVEYDIRSVKGLKNMFFGGEGLFLAYVKGPGKVWLQSMPLSNLAMKLASYMPTKSN
jgi:uncharacterized protein (TIGR00266 family)